MLQNPHQNHSLLWRALLFSLVLHMLLMLQTVTLPSIFPGASRKLLSARLSLRALLPMSSYATDDAPAHQPLRPLPPRQQAQSAILRTVLQRSPDETSVRELAAVVPQAVTTPSALPANVPEVRSSAITTAPPAQAQAVEADFAESKKTYLFAIAAEARRIKKYPSRALASGWVGTAYIRIVVSAGGHVQSPVLDKSSGHEDIDNAALAMVRAALADSPLPESLRNRSFELILPVVFNLAEQ